MHKIIDEEFKDEIKEKDDDSIYFLIKNKYKQFIVSTENDNLQLSKYPKSEFTIKLIRLNNKILQSKEQSIDELINIINEFLKNSEEENDFTKYQDVKIYLRDNLTNFKYLFLNENKQIDINNINNFIEKINLHNDYKGYFKNFIYSNINEDILRKK